MRRQWWGMLLILVPGLSAHPAQLHTRGRSDLDAGALRSAHRLFHALHEVLRVAHQHVCCLLVLLRTYTTHTKISVWSNGCSRLSRVFNKYIVMYFDICHSSYHAPFIQISKYLIFHFDISYIILIFKLKKKEYCKISRLHYVRMQICIWAITYISRWIYKFFLW